MLPTCPTGDWLSAARPHDAQALQICSSTRRLRCVQPVFDQLTVVDQRQHACPLPCPSVCTAPDVPPVYRCTARSSLEDRVLHAWPFLQLGASHCLPRPQRSPPWYDMSARRCRKTAPELHSRLSDCVQVPVVLWSLSETTGSPANKVGMVVDPVRG